MNLARSLEQARERARKHETRFSWIDGVLSACGAWVAVTFVGLHFVTFATPPDAGPSFYPQQRLRFSLVALAIPLLIGIAVAVFSSTPTRRSARILVAAILGQWLWFSGNWVLAH